MKTPRLVAENISSISGALAPKEFRVPIGYKGMPSWKRKLLSSITFGIKGGYTPKPKAPISLEDLLFIRSQLDIDLEECFGYDIDMLYEQELLALREIDEVRLNSN